MSLQIVISYRNTPVVYDVSMAEDGIYNLRLVGNSPNGFENYVPEKMLIRRKGKIWICDIDNHEELVKALTEEIMNFHRAA